MSENAPPRHSWQHTVRIFELDPYVHANHTAYLQWLEEGREAFLVQHGFSFLRFLEEDTPLVMVNMNVDFTGQARWGDVVEVETRLERFGRTSVRFGHRISIAGGSDVLVGTATMVFVGRDRKPVSVPGDFRAALSPP
jgi:acyl-CoA thioester hydrolase